jgi:DNA-binding transcriptional ArsR family regulator
MNVVSPESSTVTRANLSVQSRVLPTLHLTSQEAAIFFVQPRHSCYLLPFMRSEVSLSEAAEKCKLSKSHMSYWLNKMLEFGIIERIRTEKRGRHNVPIYRATAQSFTVPMQQVPVSSDEEILTLNSRDFNAIERRSIIRSSSNNEGWNLCFSCNDRFPQLRMLPADGVAPEPKHLDKWGCLALTESQAQSLRSEMQALLDRYRQAETLDGKDHLYKFLLVEAKM